MAVEVELPLSLNIFAAIHSAYAATVNLTSGDRLSGSIVSATPEAITLKHPLLGELADNGGPTWTHALLPGSPAIDAGDPAFAPPPFYDQRGVGYPRVVNERIDIGAFELGTGNEPGPGGPGATSGGGSGCRCGAAEQSPAVPMAFVLGVLFALLGLRRRR